jgi:hypothetical protein
MPRLVALLSLVILCQAALQGHGEHSITARMIRRGRYGGALGACVLTTALVSQVLLPLLQLLLQEGVCCKRPLLLLLEPLPPKE